MQYIRWRARAWSVCRLVLFGFLLSSTAASATADSQLEELATRAGFRIISRGDSSSARQKQAKESIPLGRMTPVNRDRAAKVIQGCNQFRTLPELQYSADPAIYRYLIQHPDVAVSTWRVMGISKFQMWQTGPTEYEAEAVDGSEGIADVLYRDDQQIVFVCDGQYHNPLLPKPLAASALVWFRFAFSPGADGQQLVSQKADVFVAFPSQSLSTVAKILTPVTNSMMDRNVFEVSLYAGMMSRAVRDEPDWIIQVARQMDGVLPQRETELIEIARVPRSPRTDRTSSNSNPDGDRKRLLSSGISLFEPPKPEDVIAGSAPPSAQVTTSEPITTSQPKLPAKTVSNPKRASDRTSEVAQPGVQIKPAERVKTQETSSDPDGFQLQQDVTPPANTRRPR
ncbi:MAG: hypothetical protein JNL58_03150 [Planctomyces sp.]|nr:hypothetical protein [Planctomyces sp.]